MTLQQRIQKPVTRSGTSKLSLFCPTCDHASPLDGDWTIDKTDTRYRVQCPVCDSFVVDRKRL
jgi:transcription elongation factor Elf1